VIMSSHVIMLGHMLDQVTGHVTSLHANQAFLAGKSLRKA